MTGALVVRLLITRSRGANVAGESAPTPASLLCARTQATSQVRQPMHLLESATMNRFIYITPSKVTADLVLCGTAIGRDLWGTDRAACGWSRVAGVHRQTSGGSVLLTFDRRNE
jgi:hypothetical protein